MSRFIFDASVAVKWFFEEKLSEKAKQFLILLNDGKIEIVVPEFFYLEFANVCWKKFKMGLVSVTQALRALDDIVELSLTRYSDYELSDVALENALRFNISAYDGLYVALAEIYVAPLVTADKALLKACQGRFDFIEPLSEVAL